MNEKLLRQLIQKDRIGDPDPHLKQQLQQAFLLRSAGYRLKQNSFAGFSGWLFSGRQVIPKMAFAAMLTAFFLIKPGLNPNIHGPVLTDSTRIDQSLVSDSALMKLSNKADNDSLF